MEAPLTHSWLTEVLIGVIIFLVGIIGWMIRNYLSSINRNIEGMKKHFAIHLADVNLFLVRNESRLTRIETHIGLGENRG